MEADDGERGQWGDRTVLEDPADDQSLPKSNGTQMQIKKDISLTSCM